MRTEVDDSPFCELDAYHLELGRLISVFAEVESAIQGAAVVLSGLPIEEALETCGKKPVSACVKSILKLRHERRLPVEPSLEGAFAQLALIAATRNDIVHRGANVEVGSAATRLGFQLADTFIQRDVSPAALIAMRKDLRTILAAVSLIMLDAAITAGGPPRSFAAPFERSAQKV